MTAQPALDRGYVEIAGHRDGSFDVGWRTFCQCCGGGQRLLAFGERYADAKKLAEGWAETLGLAIRDGARPN